MGSTVDKRLKALESRVGSAEEELRQSAYRELLKRLTPEEHDWLGEPSHEAEMLVACPIHGSGCECTNEPRRQSAREECPELHEEFQRRNRALLEKREEILAREPYQETPADWRRRYAHAGA